MKKERFIVEIEMPDGDGASSAYICDVIQCDCDVEDEGRWKVSVKECWKPSDEQLEALESTTENCAYSEYEDCLKELIKQLKQL